MEQPFLIAQAANKCVLYEVDGGSILWVLYTTKSIIQRKHWLLQAQILKYEFQISDHQQFENQLECSEAELPWEYQYLNFSLFLDQIYDLDNDSYGLAPLSVMLS